MILLLCNFSYTWYINDEVFEPSVDDGRITITPGVGTLVFTQSLARDEAIYQCVAANEAGKALTVKVDLRRGGKYRCQPSKITIF